VDPRDAVGAGEHLAREVGKKGAQARIGPSVRLNPYTQPDQLTTAKSAQLKLLHLAAALSHRQETLRPALHPADRPCQPLGEGGHDHLLGIDRQLRPKATTDVRCDADHFVFREAEAIGHEVSDLKWALCRCPDPKDI